VQHSRVTHVALRPPGDVHANLGHRLNRPRAQLMYGVVLFFTLSGFLLYRPFAASIVRGERMPSLSRYLRNCAAPTGCRLATLYGPTLIACAKRCHAACRERV
jgi:hypothetical protein